MKRLGGRSGEASGRVARQTDDHRAGLPFIESGRRAAGRYRAGAAGIAHGRSAASGSDPLAGTAVALIRNIATVIPTSQTKNTNNGM